MRTIEFFFDVGSPTTYLAHTQLPGLAAQAGAVLVHRPMLLGGVFKATGNVSPVTVAAKARWLMADLPLWARHWGVPFRFNPHFPVNTLGLMRIAAGLQQRQDASFMRCLDTVFQALWVDARNLGDPAELRAVLAAAGLDAEDLMTLASDPQAKAALLATTEEAVARGVFGAPTCLVGEALFFGQDRLDFVRAAVQATPPG